MIIIYKYQFNDTNGTLWRTTEEIDSSVEEISASLHSIDSIFADPIPRTWYTKVGLFDQTDKELKTVSRFLDFGSVWTPGYFVRVEHIVSYFKIPEEK